MNDYTYEEHAGVHRFTFSDTGMKTFAALMEDVSRIVAAAPRDGRPIRLVVDARRNMIDESLHHVLREVRRVEALHPGRPHVRIAIIHRQTPLTSLIELVIGMTRGSGDQFRFVDTASADDALEWVLKE